MGDRVLEALGAAAVRLAAAGLSPTSTLRDAQYAQRGGERVPIHGGNGREGIANIITYDVFKTTLAPATPRGDVVNEQTDLTSLGYVVNYGSSFVMSVDLGGDGPTAASFVTYGQSDDPASEHHVDQTRRFSDKAWRPILYTEEEILADEELRIESIGAERASSESDAE
jgi:acyl-homoserine-lactone acylase